ncbi:hypothetical protein SK224_16015 [Microbacterium sp. BG28]|uniref:hypothetical protein n=1 Tax=Microbacterium sp. BG28 TaxID=3097356 RepID=UPI002A5A933D|nr:hypothetical protein [Microbacterium sp. BG28]MDY0830642.1 hypothetical protein [Microbacterium sp. BG28]
MKLSITKVAAAGLALSLGLGIAGFGATAASAAVGDWTPNGTPEPYFLYSLDSGAVVPSGTPLTYTTGLVAAPSATDPDQRFADAPSGAESTYIFISPRGKESSIADWATRVDIGFEPGTNRVLQAPASLNRFPSNSFASIKAAGGDYSMGIAYTKNNGVTFVGLGAFAYIHITAGTADWTYEYPTQATTPTDPTDPTGQIAIEAPVAAPVDGALSLSIPTGEKATLGSAALDNTGKSVSTGILPTFQVSDERYATKPGWTVNTSVATFTSGSSTIDPTALAIVPAVKSTSTATGVSVVSALTGAKEAAKFAEAEAGKGTGKTDLSAALTLTAPLGTPAGTYTSTMTVTVVSK